MALKERILETTMSMMKGETSLRSITVDEVARHAQTSKATIYKHWSSKSTLFVESFFHSFDEELVFDQTVSRREAIRKQIKRLAILLESPEGDALRTLIAESHFDSEMRNSLLDGFFHPRRASAARFIAQAIEEGTFRADVIPMVAVDALYGGIFYALMIGHRRLEAEWIDQLVDTVVRGLEA